MELELDEIGDDVAALDRAMDHAPVDAPSSGHETILLIEDDPGARRLFETAARRGGVTATILTAPTLAEGLATLERRPVELVVLDLGLPDASELEGLEQLREGLPDVPVVVLTSTDDRPGLGVSAVRAGAQDFLVKGSVDPDELGLSIRFAIEREHLRRLVDHSVLARSALAGLEARGRDATTVTQVLEEALAAAEATIPRGRFRLRVEVLGEEFTHPSRPPSPDGDGAVVERTLQGSTATGVLAGWVPDRRPLQDHEHAFLDRLAGMTIDLVDGLVASRDLTQRTEQLRALFEVAKLLSTDDEDSATTIRGVAGLLHRALRRPHCTAVEVLVGDTRADAGAAAEDVQELTNTIVVAHEVVGHVRATRDEDHQWLADERLVVEQASDLLGGWLARRRAERAHEESRRQMELVLGQLPAVVWSCDRDLVFTSIRGSGLEVLAEVPEPGDSLVAYFGGDEDSPAIVGHREALAGRPTRYTLHLDEAAWDVGLQPLLARGGEVVGVLGLGVDVTAEAEARARAEEERRRYRALFEGSRDAIVLSSGEGRIVDANPAMCELTGRTHDELLGLRSVDLVAPMLSPDDVEELRAQLVDEGEQRGVLPVMRADGTVIDVEYHSVADVVDGLNLSILRDVTARRAVQRDLAVSEERFRVLAEHAVEGIFRVTTAPERTFEYVNPAFERITGFTLADVREDPDVLRERTHQDDVVLDEETDAKRIRFRRRDDTWRWLELRQTAILDDAGTTVAVQGVVLDVTDQQRHTDALESALRREQEAAEELRRLDELKDGFLRAVSHELRTPLAAIYGFSETLLDRGSRLDTAQAGDLLQRLQSNAERLRLLLEDLFDINRLTSTDIQPQRTAVDLAELARRVADDVALGHRTLHLSLGPAPARLEPPRVLRIVHNLLSNVAKHTPEGTTVWLHTAALPDGAVELVVEDDGPGIPPELHPTITDPFTQGPASAAAPSPGTGVGLSIVHQFTRMHGGRVEVSERPGGGARFRLEFPAA